MKGLLCPRSAILAASGHTRPCHICQTPGAEERISAVTSGRVGTALGKRQHGLHLQRPSGLGTGRAENIPRCELAWRPARTGLEPRGATAEGADEAVAKGKPGGLTGHPRHEFSDALERARRPGLVLLTGMQWESSCICTGPPSKWP